MSRISCGRMTKPSAAKTARACSRASSSLPPSRSPTRRRKLADVERLGALGVVELGCHRRRQVLRQVTGFAAGQPLAERLQRRAERALGLFARQLSLALDDADELGVLAAITSPRPWPVCLRR
jgi:hypothetical protein